MEERASRAKHDFKRIVKDLPHKVDAMRRFLIRHTAASVIEGLLFPLGIFLAFWLALKQSLRRIVQLIDRRPAKKPG